MRNSVQMPEICTFLRPSSLFGRSAPGMADLTSGRTQRAVATVDLAMLMWSHCGRNVVFFVVFFCLDGNTGWHL